MLPMPHASYAPVPVSRKSGSPAGLIPIKPLSRQRTAARLSTGAGARQEGRAISSFFVLPVLLLAGLAKKLFAPLALTVAVAMIASYFVSMSVTPVACRYFLGHLEPGQFGRRIEQLIDGIADAYARGLRRVLPEAAPPA